jgi:hypothetical protein
VKRFEDANTADEVAKVVAGSHPIADGQPVRVLYVTGGPS